MAKLSTLNKKGVRPVSRAKNTDRSAYDWDTFTGNMGTISPTWKATSGGGKLKAFGSSFGSGSPYVSVYMPTDDARVAILDGGVTIEADDVEVREQSNGKFKLIAEMLPTSDGGRVEQITIGGFPTRELAESFVKVAIKTTH